MNSIVAVKIKPTVKIIYALMPWGAYEWKKVFPKAKNAQGGEVVEHVRIHDRKIRCQGFTVESYSAYPVSSIKDIVAVAYLDKKNIKK